MPNALVCPAELPNVAQVRIARPATNALTRPAELQRKGTQALRVRPVPYAHARRLTLALVENFQKSFGPFDNRWELGVLRK